MKKYQKFSICSLILVILFNLSINGLLAAELSINPVIVAVLQNEPELLNKPMVTGLCPENSEVMIYLDGIYEGNANVNREQTGIDNFYYQIKQNLSEGTHAVFAIAKDRTSLRLSDVSNEYSFTITPLTAPTLIQPDENTITGKVKPFITGLTVNNTLVHIFIDDVYNGKTEYLQHESGTANFKYTPFLNLAPGWHTAWAKTEDKSGRISSESNILHFRIENPNPAPSILSTIVNNKTSQDRPFISGVAKNNSKVRVFIDNTLNGEFLVINHVSGTAHFNYKPFLSLKPGRHMVYTTAVDMRGKESVWSNIVYFNVGASKPMQAAETKSVGQSVSAGEEPIEKKDFDNEAAKPAPAKETETVKTVEEDKTDLPASDIESKEINPDVKDILNPENKSTSTEEKGLINESKEQQGKLKLNLIIFIIFLFMVIAWIFWVNRELIKERREQNENEKDDQNL